MLQEGELERVGGSGLVEVNVRIIAATNRDLLAEVAEGRFREDLYYRLNVVPIQVPALKERLDDVPELAAYLLSLAIAEHELEHREFSESALEVLSAYPWPGNVLELAHTVARLRDHVARAARRCRRGEARVARWLSTGRARGCT